MVLLAATACTREPPDLYVVVYDDRTYDKAEAEDASARCTRLPGVSEKTRQSPDRTSALELALTFRGGNEQRKRFEGCLRGLPGALTLGPLRPGEDPERLPTLGRQPLHPGPA